jgi:hypothetical protein
MPRQNHSQPHSKKVTNYSQEKNTECRICSIRKLLENEIEGLLEKKTPENTQNSGLENEKGGKEK